MSSSTSGHGVRDLMAALHRMRANLDVAHPMQATSVIDEIRATTGLEAAVRHPEEAGDRPTAFAVPVLLGPDDHVAAIICGLDHGSGPIDEDRLAFARLLAESGAAMIAHEVARQDVEDRTRRSDALLLETLEFVRSSQDQVGNSLAVVLGWLRLVSGPKNDGPLGGIQVAIRRLEEAQATVAELLRRTTEAALQEHASDPVNVSDLLRELGRRTDDGPDIWIRGNRTFLSGFLTAAGAAISREAVLTPRAWTLPFRDAGLLTTSLVLSLIASGGRLTTIGPAQAAEWPRIPTPGAP